MAPELNKKSEYSQKKAPESSELKVGVSLDEHKMEDLKELRNSLLEVRKVRRKTAIEKGKTRAKKNAEIPESFSGAKNKKEKQAFLREIIRGELKYSNDEIHAITYGEQKTYGYNQERFNDVGEKKGWIGQYEEYYKKNQRSKDVKSMESFILEKQFEEMDKTRESLTEARTEAFLVKMEPKLGDEGKKDDLELKKQDLLEDVDGFMKINSKEIEHWVKTGELDKYEALGEKFNANLFGQIDKTDLEKSDLIQGYFDDLMQDYRQMMVEKSTLEKLNPQMVQMMIEGVDEEEWNERLLEEAAKKVQQMEEEKAVEEALDAPIYTSDITEGQIAADIGYDLIPPGSQITFEKVSDGKYKITYPGKKYQTYFEVHQTAKTDQENPKLQFVFNDRYLDGGRKVTDAEGFAEQVNALHLEQVMNRDFKRGRDYQGVELNEVFNDESMLEVAKMLLYPKSLKEMPLTDEDVRVFKNMVKILTNSENNDKGKGIYGDLRVLGHRIALLKTILVLPNNAAKFKQTLNGKNSQLNKSVNDLNLETFLSEYVGAEANYGNFQKR
ncbi:MAG: hypothetical protein ACRCZE_00780 [Candidatus Altimarinota bacterium]